MSQPREVKLQVRIDSEVVTSETTFSWAGPYTLAIATALPDRGLALEVHSSFLGHAGVPTLASHIVLGPVGKAPYALSAEHAHEHLDPTVAPRQCIYEHTLVLVEALKATSRDASIDVPDDAFAALERVGE